MRETRDMLNAIFYVLSTGCQWDALPTGLPSSTVYDRLGILELMHTRFRWPLASRPAGKRARVLPSLTRRAPKER